MKNKQDKNTKENVLAVGVNIVMELMMVPVMFVQTVPERPMDQLL